MTSKYACFDIGDVLCHVDFQHFLDALSETMNISKDDANYFLSRTQKLHDLGLTDIKSELRDHFKIHSEVVIEDLLNFWNEAVWNEEIMFQLLSDLIENDVKIALLSNIGVEHVAHLHKISENLKGWKGSIHFFSCQVGARKPSMLYYQSFLMQYPKFRNSFYIDNLQENLDAGKQHGFRTVCFDLTTLNGKNHQITQQNIKASAEKLKTLILK